MSKRCGAEAHASCTVPFQSQQSAMKGSTTGGLLHLHTQAILMLKRMLAPRVLQAMHADMAPICRLQCSLDASTSMLTLYIYDAEMSADKPIDTYEGWYCASTKVEVRSAR